MSCNAQQQAAATRSTTQQAAASRSKPQQAAATRSKTQQGVVSLNKALLALPKPCGIEGIGSNNCPNRRIMGAHVAQCSREVDETIARPLNLLT
jgi:uncharacterized protein (DUF2345 family)